MPPANSCSSLDPLVSRGAWHRAALGIGVAMAVLAAGIAPAAGFCADDAFISLRYSERLVGGLGLTWTDGERVEGYSNLLWVLACSLLHFCGFDLTAAARGLGVACIAATLSLLVVRLRRNLCGALAPAVLAAAAPLSAWAVGGLEGPLLLLCWTAAALELERALAGQGTATCWRAGVWLALGCLCRPEGPLLVAIAAACLAARSASAGAPVMRPLLALLCWPAVAVVGQLAFRLSYYGDWLPNTARVKLRPGSEALAGGLAYLGNGLLACAPLVVLAVAGLWTAGRPGRRWPAAFLAVAALAWCGYVAAIGGDHFPAWRMLVPLLGPLALLAGLLAESLGGGSRRAQRVGLCIVVLAVAGGLLLARIDPRTVAAARERWAWDGKTIGEAMASAFPDERPLLAVDAAGGMPFGSRFPSLDMLGLCDRTIGGEPRDPVSAQNSWFQTAHQRGSPDYLLRRAPDLFSFGMYPGEALPRDPAALALVDDVRFVRGYRCVYWRCADRAQDPLVAGELGNPFWISIDGRIGVRTAPDYCTVPAWFLGSLPMVAGFRLGSPEAPLDQAGWRRHFERAQAWSARAAVARVVDGRPGLEVRRPGRFTFEGLSLAPGRWRAQLVPPHPGWEVDLRDAGGAALARSATAFEVVPATGASTLVLSVADAQALPLHAQRIELVRE